MVACPLRSNPKQSNLEEAIDIKRHNIELVLGFLDAVRRGDHAAAAACLDREIVWRGVLPELVCRGPEEVLDIFMRRRGDEEPEVERLELS